MMRNPIIRYSSILDVRQHPSWGVVPLCVLIWHSLNTANAYPLDNFFYVCYTANFILAVGILTRRAMLTGAGFGWMVVAAPLWLYDSAIHHDWELSCAAFHLCGLAVGALAVARQRLPKHTWIFTLSVGLLLLILSRLFTKPELNVNAAFRVYDGWEFLFTDYRVFVLSAIAEVSAVFALIQQVNNRYVRDAAEQAP